MKSMTEWKREQYIFKLTNDELLERVQVDAYNSAVKDVILKHQLLATTTSKAENVGKSYKMYSPSFGEKTITLDVSAIKKLLKQE